MKKNENKIIFSKEIDSNINSIAVIVTFFLIGIFLLFNKQYFGNIKVTKFVQWTFIIIGTLGFFYEFQKLKKYRESKLQGLDNITAGIILFLVWLGEYKLLNHWIANSLFFIFLIFGMYGTIIGFLQLIYSISKMKKENTTKSKITREVIKDILVMFSQIGGIVLIVIQVLQAISIIK